MFAARYQGPAAALLAKRVRKGSTGVWGQVPMPPTDKAKVSDTELKAVIGWLLTTP